MWRLLRQLLSLSVREYLVHKYSVLCRSLWSNNDLVDVPARVEDVFGVELFFDAFEEDGGFGAAAPDEVGGEAFESCADDLNAAAEFGHKGAEAADEGG